MNIPLRAAVVVPDGVSLPSDDGPADTADRLMICARRDYVVTLLEGEAPCKASATFIASTSGERNTFVTAVVAALFQRMRGSLKETVGALQLAKHTIGDPMFDVEDAGDSVSFASDDAPPAQANRLHILAGDDLYASVSPPFARQGFPAVGPCFRACTSGTRNPFVASMFGALFRRAKNEHRSVSDVLDMEIARLRRQLRGVES